MEPRLGCDGLAGFQIARDRAGVWNDEGWWNQIKFPTPKITLDIVLIMFHLYPMPSQTGSGSRR
jgi:hypothetical protein